MKRLLAGFVVLFGVMATAMAWAQSPTLDRIKKNGVIRVGVKTDYKPFGYLDPSGRIVGLEVDLAADVARRLNVKLELVPVQTANRIEFLQQGRIDLMIATMSVNDQRRKVVGVVEPFYYAGGTSLLVRKNSPIKRWEDIRGRAICGTQGAYYNRPVSTKYGANIVAFPGSTEALNALLTGACEGFVQDSTLIESILVSGDPKWADYDAPLPVEDYQPWALAVHLDELKGPWGDFMRNVVTDWHSSGFLIATEQKAGLKASDYLKDMKANPGKAS